MKKQVAKPCGDSENAMEVLDTNDFERHRGSPVNVVHIITGGTKAGMAAERNKLEITAGRAGVHGATKRRIAARDQCFYIFDDRVTKILNINHFFEMVFKNFLQNIHKTIMKKKETPIPSKMRNRRGEVSQTLSC